jgi:hypothetical protein
MGWVSVSGGWKKLQQAGLWPVDTAPQLPYLKKKRRSADFALRHP